MTTVLSWGDPALTMLLQVIMLFPISQFVSKSKGSPGLRRRKRHACLVCNSFSLSLALQECLLVASHPLSYTWCHVPWSTLYLLAAGLACDSKFLWLANKGDGGMQSQIQPWCTRPGSLEQARTSHLMRFVFLRVAGEVRGATLVTRWSCFTMEHVWLPRAWERARETRRKGKGRTPSGHTIRCQFGQNTESSLWPSERHCWLLQQSQ